MLLFPIPREEKNHLAGLFGLSTDPAFGDACFLEDLFWGTFYHQHLEIGRAHV